MDENKRMTNDDLYIRQVKMLRGFLAHKAITREQFEKSCGDLTVKMYPDGNAPQVK